MLSEADRELIVNLRRSIHTRPELSNAESLTSSMLQNFMRSLKNAPSLVTGIGGTGFLAIFDYNREHCRSDRVVIFRSELDAVSVVEANDFAHASLNHGVSHKCGHDGHMAILAGLAVHLSDHFRPANGGRAVLLFQPAEEIGAGAQQMVDHKHPELSKLLSSSETKIFAIHNVPGFPAGSIVLPRGMGFASASRGMHIKLGGACCHAAQPHLGRNPALATCNIITSLLALPSLYIPYDQKAIVTIVGAKMGDKSFGVSAGDSEIMATLRSTSDAGMNVLVKQATNLVSGIAKTYHLSHSIAYEDAFSATRNHAECVTQVQEASKSCGFELLWTDEAFPWSEDFGVFLNNTKGAMFGVGMGESHEPLHGERYDFDDNQIWTGVEMFTNLVNTCLSAKQ